MTIESLPHPHDGAPPQLRVTAISGGVTVPSSRYRIDALLASLRQKHWSTHSIHGYGDWDRAITHPIARKSYRLACRAKRAIVTQTLRVDHPVIVQRLAIPTWGPPETQLARRNGRVVIDFDDAIFLDSKQRECGKRKRALDQVFLAARHVVAGNEWLAEHVPDACVVSVIPTCLDTETYVPRADVGESPEEPIRIGWIGTSSNFRHLEQLVEPLKAVRAHCPQVEFAVCSDVRWDDLFSRLDATFVPWSAKREVEILQSFDVGLMPLADEDWCRGKCAFKLIQYLAVGIPSVCSPVGMNCEVVQDGENGLYARNQDWATPIIALLDSPELRMRIGRKARDTAEERFALRKAADAYDRILRSML